MAVKRWGDYEIYFDRLLGRGGMGAVYMGRQVSVDRPVAIKILKRDLTDNPDFVKRFHREAALLARLVDSHVVQVFGAGDIDGEHFYAMEYVEGEDLAARLKRGQRVTNAEILTIAVRTGKALQAAWRHRITHRDIKPSNIVVTKDGLIKVMDFGLAKNPDTDLTQSEMIMGTAKYMSPEQATGAPVDIRSDLYSLGVVLYELATGVAPFSGENLTSVIYQHVHKQPVPPRNINPDLPASVQALILRLMAKAPEERYAAPEDFLRDAKSILDGVTTDEKTILLKETSPRLPVGDTAAEPPPSPPLKRSRPAALYVSLAAAAGLIGVAGFFVAKAMQTPIPAPIPVPSPKTDPESPRPAAWTEARRLGFEAFGAKLWSVAYTQLEEAQRLGAPELDEKIRQARANELKDKGNEEADDEKALEHYENAQKFVDDEEVRRKIARASFRRWSKSAEKREGGDWKQAAADWERALPFVDEAQKEETEARAKFCAMYADAVRARTGREWTRASDLFKELAKNPREYAREIEKEIEVARIEMARTAGTEEEQIKKDFAAILEEGREAYRRAAWKEAKGLLDRAGDPRFAKLPKDSLAKLARELEVAVAAPAGMVFVPAGKFRMGGGRPVEGPEGEAETAAFYIDDHEVTAAEYGEFLQALEGTDHHAGCAKDEPKEGHKPSDGASQKPADPVTNVTWWDATSYAAWRKKRLPTEAEWEKAAGFDLSGKRVYPWGDKYQKEGGKSFFGCDAMGSGVIEWTADWFDRYPWSSAANAEFGQRKRALRGGVLLAEDAEQNAKVTFRYWHLPSYRARKIGFRCVQDISEK